jgi:hypothetical protein
VNRVDQGRCGGAAAAACSLVQVDTGTMEDSSRGPGPCAGTGHGLTTACIGDLHQSCLVC